MEEKIANKILQELSAIRQEFRQELGAIRQEFKQELGTFKADTEKRFDAHDKRFDTLEKELAIVKRATLIMEHELTKKVDILLETRVNHNNNYENLNLEVAKLNELTEMHSMQIEFIQNKCASKCQN